MRPICGYCNGCKKKTSIIRPICRYCNGYKKKTTSITRPICRYYNGCKKNQHLLQDLYAGIAYLKWPYGNYNRKDVGITQYSFWYL